MKKILLSFMLMLVIKATTFSQLALNELYLEPNCGVLGTTMSDYFELYNATGSDINLDCYKLVVTYKSGTGPNQQIWAYVFDLPNKTILKNNLFVFAGLNTFCYQGGNYTLNSNGYNWNDPNNTSNGASLKRYKLSGGTTGTWVLDQTYSSITPLYDLLAISNGSAKYNVYLFNASVTGNADPENVIFFGYNSTTPPSDVTALPLLNDAILGTCSGNGNIAFSSITSNEQVTSASGSDNGYFRKYDGICGTWEKANNAADHTPGSTNSSTTPAGSGTFTLTSSLGECVGGSGTYKTDITVTPISGTPYPLTYFVVTDNIPYSTPSNPQIGSEDVQFTTGTYSNGDALNKFTVSGLISETAYFVRAVNAAGCFSAVIYVPAITCATLPVSLKSFTAVRNKNNVLLKWETASEQNNRGFDVQRFIGSGNWESVAFVSSRGANGSSAAPLNYEYTDINTTKGISQYRIQQVDLDGKSAYSMIRSIRGEGQTGKTILYPNPSSNGKVNIVFEDGNVTRDVTLIDMNGRTVKQWKGTSNNNIQMENLNAGFYTVLINNRETGEQTSEKIIVNKR